MILKSLPVVIVVGDFAVRSALHFYLTASGFIVSPWRDCRSPPSPEQTLQSRCIILDCHLPTLDGIDIIESMRRKGNRVPAILLVEQMTKELEKRAAALEACDLLQVPLFGTTLEEAIDKIAT